MSETDTTNIRNTTDKEIKSTFRGILRIGNISEAEPKDDTANNVQLYSLSDDNNFPFVTTDGTQFPTPVLQGKLKRYNKVDDPLGIKRNRIPVTDSTGNYLYWNLGINGLTIGSDIFPSKSFSVLETSEIECKNNSYLSEIKLGNIQFEMSNGLNNNYVIYADENTVINTKNIDEMIDEKLKEFDNRKKITQIPTGTIIQHFISFDKFNKPEENDYFFTKLKDNYLICNGQTVTLEWGNDRHLNLFYNIGYAYSNKSDADEQFQKDFLTWMCCKEIENKVKLNGKENLTENTVKENLSLPENYPFNYQVFDNTNPDTYEVIDGVKIGKKIENFNSIIETDTIKKFIQSQLGTGEQFKPPSITFNVPSLISKTFEPTFIGSQKLENPIVTTWSAGKNDFIIPHRHFIAVSKGYPEKISEDEYTIIFDSFNKNDDNIYNSIKSNKIHQLKKSSVLLAEHNDFNNNLSEVFDIYNDSYIIRDCPVTLKSTQSNILEKIFYSSEEEISKLPKTLYGGFNTLVAYDDDFITTVYDRDKLNDVRFSNAEPNRGLSGDAIFTSEHTDKKSEINKINFSISQDQYFFSMENVTSLPLIKI